MVMPSLLTPVTAEAVRDRLLGRVEGRVPTYVRDESDFVYVVCAETGRLVELNIQLVNATARQMLVRFAVGDSLDELGASLGVVRETGETDSAYRARIQRRPDDFGGVGSSAYIETAVLNRADVNDVLVVPRANGQDIDIYVQSPDSGGQSPPSNPTDATIAALNTYMNASNRVLAGWTNHVSRPSYVSYSVAVSYTWRTTDPSAAIRTAIYEFVNAHRRLNMPVYRSALSAAVMGVGGGVVNVSAVTLNGSAADLDPAAGTVYYAPNTTANIVLTATEEA